MKIKHKHKIKTKDKAKIPFGTDAIKEGLTYIEFPNKLFYLKRMLKDKD
jgi:hypothetical protein